MFVAFVASLLLSLWTIPSIVHVARIKGLCEMPDQRRLHKGVVPTLGGVAVFAAFMVINLIFCQVDIKFLASSLVILFFLGIKDDILMIAPVTKLLGQIFSSSILCIFGDIRFTNLHGILGLYEIPYWFSFVLTVFVIIFVINAFNLIDGIDGLAALLGMSAALLFGYWFYLVGQIDLVVMVLSFAGAILGFIRHNLFSKSNKIFLGDTGSQIVGFFCAYLAIKFNELNLVENGIYHVNNSPVVSIMFMCVPIYDVFRVSFIRIKNKQNIMQADNNHIHYRLLSLGLSHKQIDLTLVGFTLIINLFVILFERNMTMPTMFLTFALVLFVCFLIPGRILYLKNKKK